MKLTIFLQGIDVNKSLIFLKLITPFVRSCGDDVKYQIHGEGENEMEKGFLKQLEFAIEEAQKKRGELKDESV